MERRLGVGCPAAAALATAFLVTLLAASRPGAPATVRRLLTRYGLVALFVLFVAEGAQVLVVVPSESLVPAAILALADSLPEYAAVVAVAVVGATLGQSLVFGLARSLGREWLLGARWFPVSERRLARFEAWFDRWGSVAVPVSNALPVVRGLAVVPAGLAGMRRRRFVVLSASGTLVFETALGAATLGIAGAL